MEKEDAHVQQSILRLMANVLTTTVKLLTHSVRNAISWSLLVRPRDSVNHVWEIIVFSIMRLTHVNVLLGTGKMEISVLHALMVAKNVQTLHTVNCVPMKQVEMQMVLVPAHKKLSWKTWTTNCTVKHVMITVSFAREPQAHVQNVPTDLQQRINYVFVVMEPIWALIWQGVFPALLTVTNVPPEVTVNHATLLLLGTTTLKCVWRSVLLEPTTAKTNVNSAQISVAHVLLPTTVKDASMVIISLLALAEHNVQLEPTQINLNAPHALPHAKLAQEMLKPAQHALKDIF